MEKEIKVYRADTKKPRTEFTGFMRMFEPIRNLAITVGSFILVSTLVIVVIIMQAQEAARFRLDNWNTSFETWRDAWDYVNDQDNYDTDNDLIDVYRLTNNDNYYALDGTNHVTMGQAIEKLEQRAYDKSEWTTGYSDIVLTDGLSHVDDAFYSIFDSYKAYDSADGNIVYSEFEAIESYLDISRSHFEYRNYTNADLNLVYEEYKLDTVLTYELASSYDFNEYISTDGEYTNIINHLGWKVDTSDLIDDILQSVYSIESDLIESLPIDFYNKTIWSDDRFNDGDFLESFTAWELENIGDTEIDYLADEASEDDFLAWKSSIDQINRVAWNCDDYSNVDIDTCEFTSAAAFEDDLKIYLNDYYTNIQNIKEVSVVIPYLDGVPQVDYLNNLITDEAMMEKTYIAKLIKDEVIKNGTTYSWNDTVYPGVDITEGWTGTILYEDALEWFNENINSEGWKYALKADVITGGVFDTLIGSSTVSNRFENFNNKGEVLIYDTPLSIFNFLLSDNNSNNTGINLRQTEDRNTFYRLDINNNDDNAFKSVNLIDVINYWKGKLNENRP